jgi:hypothetical protein
MQRRALLFMFAQVRLMTDAQTKLRTEPTQPAPSLHLAIHRLQELTDAMERRLARVEASTRSLRRRVVVNKQAAS